MHPLRIKAIAGLALLMAGIGLLLWRDWRIALGVFLLSWAYNIDRQLGKGR